METVDKYIELMIKNHCDRFMLHIDEIQINYLKSFVGFGYYAFQIIYGDINVNNRVVIEYLLVTDYKLLSSQVNEYNKMWSYQNPPQYKYSDKETFVLDISVIREIKLNKILNELQR